jgi:hypothetical protein
MTGLDFDIDIVLKSWVIPICPLKDFIVDNCVTVFGDVANVVGVLGPFGEEQLKQQH